MSTNTWSWRDGAVRRLAWRAFLSCCAAALCAGAGMAMAQPAGTKAKAPRKAPAPGTVVIKESSSPSHNEILSNLAAPADGVEIMFANPYGATCAGCPFTSIPRVIPADASAALVAGGVRPRNAPEAVTAGGQAGAGAQPVVSQAYQEVTAGAQDNAPGVAPGGMVARSAQAAEALVGGAAAPEDGVDSSTLGGMYAQRIHIVSTPRGLGVRQPEDAAASAAELQLGADGQILLRERGAAAR